MHAAVMLRSCNASSGQLADRCGAKVTVNMSNTNKPLAEVQSVAKQRRMNRVDNRTEKPINLLKFSWNQVECRVRVTMQGKNKK